MSETLLSVGIDIGTSTTQLVISRLTLVNRANPYAVPRVAIDKREVLYRGGIHFTPLLSDTVIDAQGVRAIVEAEYQKSGFRREDVATGAVIITGETARKKNARQVLAALSAFAGDFVVATAGPDLESILAARGAGADEYSREHHTKVLHFDIGGGTSNLALYDNGELVRTGCLDVGGRLVKLDRETGRVTYVSPSLQRWAAGANPRPTGCEPLFRAAGPCPVPAVGERVTPEALAPLVQTMTEALEQAAGLLPGRDRLDAFLTQGTRWEPEGAPVVSFSGGVADCIDSPPSDWLAFGDIGVLLGRAIAASPAFQAAGRFRGRETIRATVVGAGGAGRRRRPGGGHPGQAGVVCRPGGPEPAGPGPPGGEKPRLPPGTGTGPWGGGRPGPPAEGGLCPHRGGGGRHGQGSGPGPGVSDPRPSALPGRGGHGQRGLYRRRRAGGGRGRPAGGHQDPGVSEIVGRGPAPAVKERSHDTQNQAAGARL